MNKAYIFLKKHSSTMLSIIGSIGVIGTSILAVKATPKALKLMEEAEYEKYNNKIKKIDDDILNEEFSTFYYPEKEKLTIFEIIKATWKEYLPSILLGSSTILCIFGSNYINKKNQKALISAYILLNNSYLNYREEIKNIYGNEIDTDVFKRIANNKKENMSKNNNNEEELFFDCQSMRYFNSTMDNVKKAEYLLNELLSTNEYVYLNDLYDILGIDRVDYGYNIGWSISLNDSLYSYDKISFDMELSEIDSGLECWIINYSCPPNMNY